MACHRWLLILVSTCATAASTRPEQPSAPLAVETTPNVATLPATWPAQWVTFATANNVFDGKLVIVDPRDTKRPIKGMVRDTNFASAAASRANREIYTAETFYTRLSRGERTDVMTIWDATTLLPKGEVVLPGGKRAQSNAQQASLALTAGDRLALVWNFTPASSVSVVDIAARKVVGEVDIAGCALAYPTGTSGFYTLCSDGGVTSFALDATGKVAKRAESATFNALDDDPMFTIRASSGGIDYFPTLRGRIQPVDARGDAAQPLPAWPLVGSADAAGGWRPSGWQTVTTDRAGRLYVLMREHAGEGSHKDGAREVWVYDIARRARVARLPLKQEAVSIEIAGDTDPVLVAVTAGNGVDVYDAATGAFRANMLQHLVQGALLARAADR